MKRSPLRRISKRRSKEREQYRKDRIIFLENNPICWICGERTSNQIHHSKGTFKLRLLDQKYWIPSCSSEDCHIWVTNHPKEALERGLRHYL